jgi:hypothetical protein
MAEARQQVIKNREISAESHLPWSLSARMDSSSAMAWRWGSDEVEFFWTLAALTAAISWATS